VVSCFGAELSVVLEGEFPHFPPLSGGLLGYIVIIPQRVALLVLPRFAFMAVPPSASGGVSTVGCYALLLRHLVVKNRTTFYTMSEQSKNIVEYLLGERKSPVMEMTSNEAREWADDYFKNDPEGHHEWMELVSNSPQLFSDSGMSGDKEKREFNRLRATIGPKMYKALTDFKSTVDTRRQSYKPPAKANTYSLESCADAIIGSERA